MAREEFLAIDKFICESNNFESVEYKFSFSGKTVFVPRFIVEAKWSCDTDHMVEKWFEAQRKTDCYGWFCAFYCEMSGNNKEAMISWILENRKKGYVS